MMIGFGLFLTQVPNLFGNIFGYLSIIVGVFFLLDFLLFKSLTITANSIIKESYILGKREVEFSSLKASATKNIWSGMIMFEDKNKGFFYNRTTFFEIYPIGNDGFRVIRNILIKEKIIDGFSNGWNY